MPFGFKPYVSAAQRRARAQREVARLHRKGHAHAPVVVTGRKLATTFWGQAWNDNLEAYSDFANRLPRGRSYVRNGSVIDLQIGGGEVRASVMGSDLYEVTLKIAPISQPRWRSICKDCSGSIDSLVELLQGRLSRPVMERVCRRRDGLFPTPEEITLDCSCPDWATLCKHVAAVLYGIGVRLDEQPALLFKLRAADEAELIAGAASGPLLATQAPKTAKVLGNDDLAALFGLEMEDAARPSISPATAPAPAKALKPPGAAKKAAVAAVAKRAVPAKKAPAKTAKAPAARKKAAARSQARTRGVFEIMLNPKAKAKPKLSAPARRKAATPR